MFHSEALLSSLHELESTLYTSNFLYNHTSAVFALFNTKVHNCSQNKTTSIKKSIAKITCSKKLVICFVRHIGCVLYMEDRHDDVSRLKLLQSPYPTLTYVIVAGKSARQLKHTINMIAAHINNVDAIKGVIIKRIRINFTLMIVFQTSWNIILSSLIQ